MKKKFKKEDYIKIYRKMLQIRRFEERAAQLYGMGHIGGFCHLYIGQEAVVVGVLMTIENNDSVVTTYRDHGHMIARGLEPRGLWQSLLANKLDIQMVRVVRCICFQKKIIFMEGME